MQTKNIIIIGAGPAGLSCAIELKKISNYNVIIIEKNPEISYKVCAGGISPNTFEIDIPKEIIDREFNEMSVFTKTQSIFIRENKAIVATINRKTLHEYMAKKAKELGVKILFKKNIKKINNQSVTTSLGEKFEFDYLIGADGSNSIVRKNLNIKTKKLLTAFQYMIPGNYSHIEFHIDPDEFGFSYAWVFPQKNVISVGTGYDLNFSKKDFSVMDLRNNFETWCKKKFNLENAKFEAFSINYDYRGFEFGNIFLAGDAAGFASGLTGEGIRFAILSGKDIARKIINPKYKVKEIKHILKIKKRGENLVKLINYNEFLGKKIIELFAFFLKTKIGKKLAAKVL
ncbi:MAG: NAD(P)/FAD-dependent oxidoreductase [Patescibacteria group bacterium]|nr:NAD(P)/FAD-dependent oxidoreductase [Patescibacteria group bacterium]